MQEDFAMTLTRKQKREILLRAAEVMAQPRVCECYWTSRSVLDQAALDLIKDPDIYECVFASQELVEEYCQFYGTTTDGVFVDEMVLVEERKDLRVLLLLWFRESL